MSALFRKVNWPSWLESRICGINHGVPGSPETSGRRGSKKPPQGGFFVLNTYNVTVYRSLGHTSSTDYRFNNGTVLTESFKSRNSNFGHKAFVIGAGADYRLKNFRMQLYPMIEIQLQRGIVNNYTNYQTHLIGTVSYSF